MFFRYKLPGGGQLHTICHIRQGIRKTFSFQLSKTSINRKRKEKSTLILVSIVLIFLICHLSRFCIMVIAISQSA